MSNMNVERPTVTDSCAWILVQIRSKAGITADVAGTNDPQRAMMTMIPTSKKITAEIEGMPIGNLELTEIVSADQISGITCFK